MSVGMSPYRNKGNAPMNKFVVPDLRMSHDVVKWCVVQGVVPNLHVDEQ